MADVGQPEPAPSTARFRLGKHEDWLSAEVVQRVLDLMYEREQSHLSALLGEALTGAVPHRPRGKT